MPKRPKQIRITQNDRQEYERLARKTKGKIARTRKKYGIGKFEYTDKDGNVSKIEVPKLDSFSSRKEFNEWKEKAESFTNRYNLNYQYRKNDYGVVATKKEISEIQRNTKIAQREADRRNKQIEKLPYRHQGKTIGTVGQEAMRFSKPKFGYNRPNDFDFSKTRTRRALEVKKKSMSEKADYRNFDKKSIRMKENFMKALESIFGEDVDDVLAIIGSMPPDEFFAIYDIENDIFDFDLYDSDQDVTNFIQGKLNGIRNVLDDYVNGGYASDLILKGF